MTESEMIDAMLEFYVLRGSFNIQIDNSNRHIHNSAIQKMKAYGLIEPTGFQSFNRATQKGYKAYYGGGIDKWITDTERRENEVRQATLDSAKATEASAQFASSSAKAAWFSGAVGAVAILISLYQLYKGNEIEDRLNAMTKRAELTDSLVRVLRQSQTTSEQKGNRVLSDSLVRQVVPGAASRATGGSPQR